MQPRVRAVGRQVLLYAVVYAATCTCGGAVGRQVLLYAVVEVAEEDDNRIGLPKHPQMQDMPSSSSPADARHATDTTTVFIAGAGGGGGAVVLRWWWWWW